MRRPLFRPDDMSALPQVACGDLSIGARALAAQIPAALARAEALGAAEVAYHLRMALEVAQRLSADGQPSRLSGGEQPC